MEMEFLGDRRDEQDYKKLEMLLDINWILKILF